MALCMSNSLTSKCCPTPIVRSLESPGLRGRTLPGGHGTGSQDKVSIRETLQRTVCGVSCAASYFKDLIVLIHFVEIGVEAINQKYTYQHQSVYLLGEVESGGVPASPGVYEERKSNPESRSLLSNGSIQFP